MALALKDRTEGSTVHILTMGPQRAADIIRDAMFRGADGGYLLSGREFAGSDTLATSYALSCALKMIAPDIIFAGPSGHRRRYGAGRTSGGREAGPAAGDLCRGDYRNQSGFAGHQTPPELRHGDGRDARSGGRYGSTRRLPNAVRATPSA